MTIESLAVEGFLNCRENRDEGEEGLQYHSNDLYQNIISLEEGICSCIIIVKTAPSISLLL